MATERELIAKVLELKAALDELARAKEEARALDARLVQANADQIQGQSALAYAAGQVTTIRAQLKAML